MYIVIIIIIFILARFTIRSLFDRKWRERAQSIIDSIRNEKSFWYLMNQEINVERVFSVYIRIMNQRDYVRAGDCIMGSVHDSDRYVADPNDLDKKIITRSDGVNIINNQLNPAIQDREKIIDDSLSDNHISFSESEIRKGLENFELWADKNTLNSFSKNYGTYIYNSIDSLVKGEKNGMAVWKMIKETEEKIHDFEYDRGGENHVTFLYDLKMAQAQVSTIFINLLSEKIKDKKFAKALIEWQQLRMLSWCIVNYVVAFHGTNGIQQRMWRITTSLFL